MSTERKSIPHEDYERRVIALQEEMKKENIDVLIMHSCECESANIRWLANIWTVFDFIGGIIPKVGDAVLFTGGPESYDLVKQLSHVHDVRVNPLYVETSSPVWDKPADAVTYKQLFDEFRKKFSINKIGIANSNIIPETIVAEIKEAAPNAEIVRADDVVMHVRWRKSDYEIDMMREAYHITDEAVLKTLPVVKPGVREWEIEAEWRANAYKMGAEGVGFPIWITSGPTTFQSLCRSTERQIGNNEMVQLTLGAKYGGYCGILCRPVIVGKLPDRHMDMIKICQECEIETQEHMGPGVSFAEVYDTFQAHLKREGFGGLNLYGPAHGTGTQECEGPWVDNRTNMILEPNMTFNVDIWVADGQYGVRFESGIRITETGIEKFTTIPDEPIIL